jgi:hypothetical protein
MRRIKLLSMCVMLVLLALLLNAGPGGVVGQEPPTEQVPARVPPDQVPDEINIAGISESVQVSPSEGETVAETLVPSRVPDDQVPDVVNKVEFREVITVPVADVGSAQPFGSLDSGTVTLTYGFYWYQFSPTHVAVAGYARTESDFCAQRLFAHVKLYRDVEHNGTWEFMDEDDANATGLCVTDSGEAKTSFWTAPNNTDWKVNTEHLARWDGNTQTWERQKVDSFP